MTTAVNVSSHQTARAAISAHFAGRVSPAAEAGMREHLPTCAECRDCYRRHHLLSRLDPAAPPAQERIARALGFAPRRAPGPARWLAFSLPLAGAVAAALVVWAPGERSRGDHAVAEAPVARGAAVTAERAPRLFVYRFDGGGTAARAPQRVAPQLVDHSVRGNDELAFAYSNPAGRRYVAIFGVDDERRVYWFHPAWPVGTPAPRAIAAAPGPGPHELPEAIHHDLAGRRLTIRAAFADRPLAVGDIEAAVQSAGADSGALASRLGSDVVVTERVLDVRP